MSLKDDFGRFREATFASDQFSARRIAGEVPGLGRWALKAYNAQRFDSIDAYPHQDFDHAEILLHISHSPQDQGSWIAFFLEDQPGWKPFVGFRGMGAGRTIRAGVSYSQNLPEDDPGFFVTMNWDSTLQMYEVIGPTSDGSNGEQGRPVTIQLSAGDGSQLRIVDGVIGWTKPEA